MQLRQEIQNASTVSFLSDSPKDNNIICGTPYHLDNRWSSFSTVYFLTGIAILFWAS